MYKMCGFKRIKAYIKRKKQDSAYTNFVKECSGQMTVYLTLVLSVLLPLIMMMIDGARTSACKETLESVTEMGMDSILAEYHKVLLDRYGLLLIDTSYGEMEGSLENTKEHLKSYMAYNLCPKKDLLSAIGSRDLLGLSSEGIDFLSVYRATDNGGAVFRYMAYHYIIEKYGLGILETVEDIKSEHGEYELICGQEEDPLQDFKEAQIAITELTVERPENAGEDWEEPTKDEPASSELAVDAHGLLRKVCEGSLSGTEVHLENYASHRSLVVGDGMNPDWEDPSDVIETVIFNEYLLNVCGCYGEEKDDSVMKYQLEYIIVGKDKDVDNLKSIVWQLFGYRGIVNAITFGRGVDRTAAVNAMAASLSYITFCPEAEPIYKALIKAAWVIAESMCDVKKLMHGKKVPLVKGSSEWETSLIDALSMHIPDGTGEGSGLSYKDHLRLLLFEANLQKRTMRAIDIIEMDVRHITGQNNFRMDNCIAGGELQFVFDSKYGHSFLLKRKFSYY